METPQPKLIGILNVTPDSFSDGGKFLSPKAAIAHAEKMLEDGAEIIDIGGDSTRPGSDCVGPEVEWSRIEPVLRVLAKQCVVSIDTHHSIVAERSLALGAQIINDVMAGADRELMAAVARHDAKIILMQSRCPRPHQFTPPEGGYLLPNIISFLQEHAERAEKAGIRHENIIIDPGLGGFLSDNPDTSWDLISHITQLCELNLPVCFACSRKSFLKLPDETSPVDRDGISAYVGMLAWERSLGAVKYIRTHNVALQREFFDARARCSRKTTAMVGH